MKKIVFGITGLTLGGAERVLVDIANTLVKTYDVTIFTIYGSGELESQLDDRVKRITMTNKNRNQLNLIEKLWMSVIFRFSLLRKTKYTHLLKGKFDIEVSFLEGPITWLFSSRGTARKLAWIHNDIKEVFGLGWKAKQKKKMNNHIYKKYDELVFVSIDNKLKFKEFYPDNDISKRVIYNYLDEKVVLEKSDEFMPKIEADTTTFLQVSRLTEQKGIGRLIDTHTKLIHDGYIHHIYVIGTGPLYETLNQQIIRNQVSDTFHLLGKQKNPYPYMKHTDYFLLVSLYEGYGMVIDEAKILGKSIMITDTAAREAVIGYENSMVVDNNEEGIYQGIKKILTIGITKQDTIISEKKDIISDIKKVLEGE